MSTTLFYGFAFLWVIIPFALFIVLIYVIVKRIQDKDQENFEQRDN